MRLCLGLKQFYFLLLDLEVFLLYIYYGESKYLDVKSVSDNDSYDDEEINYKNGDEEGHFFSTDS